MVRRVTEILSAAALFVALSKSGYSQEAGRFKSSPDPEYTMPAPALLEQKKFTPDEVENTVRGWAALSNDQVKDRIKNLSDYQRGQVAQKLLFEFYKSSDRPASKEYNALVVICDYRTASDFKKGFLDTDLRDKLADDSKYGAFVDALGKEMIGKRNLPEFVSFLLEGGVDFKATVPTPQPQRFVGIKEDIFDEFISARKLTIAPGADRSAKIQTVFDWAKSHFSTNEPNAEWLARAVLLAYGKLDADGRKEFVKWLDSTDKTRLAAQVEVSWKSRLAKTPEDVLGEAFVKRMEAQLAKEKPSDIEEKMKAFPKYVRDTDAGKITAAFETTPTGERLSQLLKRVEYLELNKTLLAVKPDAKKRAEIDSELAALDAWLTNAKVPAGAIADRVKQLNGELKVIQTLYLASNSDNLKLADYLTEQKKKNPAMFPIYAKYIKGIDAATWNLLKDVDPASADFIDKVQKAIIAGLSSTVAKDGQSTWTREYYPFGQVSAGQYLETNAYAKAVALDPMVAIAFQRYYEKAKANGLTSESEKRLVVSMASKINMLHPMLAVKLFNAMEKLAEVCNENPEAFQKAIQYGLAPRVDSEVRALYNNAAPADVSIRRTITHLANSFDEVSKLKTDDLTKFDSDYLYSKRLFVRPTMPYDITQRPQPWMGLTLTPPVPAKSFTPYFLPQRIMPPMMPSLQGGGLSMSPNPDAPGSVMPPIGQGYFRFNSGASAVGTAFDNYLFADGSKVTLPRYMPGVRFTTISGDLLLNEINRAFIAKEQPDYSTEFRGASAMAFGRQFDEQYSFGGLGSYVTESGGFALGGSKSNVGGSFVGGSAVAIPVGNIRGGEASIRNAVAGFQELDDKTKMWLAQAIGQVWDKDNPKDVLLSYSGQSDQQQKSQTGKYYYIDKQGTVFEVKGAFFQTEDQTGNLTEPFTAIAGYHRKQFNSPTILAWNVQPKIGTGGAAFVSDVGKTAVLSHLQKVPFATAKGEQMPEFLQWTFAGVTTIDKKEGGRDIHEIGLPGRILQITRGTEDTLWVGQDVDYTLRTERSTAKGKIITEWTGGIGKVSKRYIATPSAEASEDQAYRAGVFYKRRLASERDETTFGAGVSYESGGTQTDTLALLNQAKAQRDYVESLHRVALTIYGSDEKNKGMVDNFVYSGLASIVPQFKSTAEGTDYDTTFYRFVGFLQGAKTGVRLDVSRISWMDTMLSEYSSTLDQIGQDPQNATTLMQNFKNKYATKVMQVFDNYYLGVKWNKNFSMEYMFVAREDVASWADQKLDSVYGKSVMRLGESEDFIRTFAAVPVINVAGMQNLSVGVMGVGTTFDVNNPVLQRLAFDAGMLLARDELSVERSWGKPGFFVQGAAHLSKVKEDVTAFRQLTHRFEQYKAAIAHGEFAGIPQDVRNVMCDNIASGTMGPQLLTKIRNGEPVALTAPDMDKISDALYSGWFNPEQDKLQASFNNRLRSYIGASGYFFSDKTYFDIGAYTESIDNFKAYIIAAKRDEMQIHGGADITSGRLTTSVIVGSTITGDKKGFGAASVKWSFTPATSLSLMGYHSSGAADTYVWPVGGAYPFGSGHTESAIFLLFTWGAPGSPSRMFNIPTPPPAYR